MFWVSEWDGIGLGHPQVKTSVAPSVTASISAPNQYTILYKHIHLYMYIGILNLLVLHEFSIYVLIDCKI